jgi:Zn-dependent protease
MSVVVPTVRARGRKVVLTRHPVPVVFGKGSLIPAVLLGGLFILYTSHVTLLVLVGAGVFGGVGGAASLVLHELGHVRGARGLAGVRPVNVSLLWLGAGTKFEGAYRSGLDQARVAAAGPVASLAFGVLVLFIALAPLPHSLQYGLFGLALLNFAIAGVSLLPVYPLDGHKVLVGLAWCALGSERRARTWIGRIGRIWLGAEAVGCCALAIERPLVGGLVLAFGATLLAQKRLGGAATRIRQNAISAR